MKISRPLEILLWPLSAIYGAAARIRASLYAHDWLRRKRLSRPVISVGNLTVGGTGKTPMVIWLAEQFLAEGKGVGILSRGYRGTSGTSDPPTNTPSANRYKELNSPMLSTNTTAASSGIAPFP